MESSTRKGHLRLLISSARLRGRISLATALVFCSACLRAQYFWWSRLTPIAWIASFLVARSAGTRNVPKKLEDAGCPFRVELSIRSP